MEDKKDKKIRLLNNEIDRLEIENEKLKLENIELQRQINELSSYQGKKTIDTFQEYENEFKLEINKLRQLQYHYKQLIEKQKKYITKEKGKYKKATNKAIAEFNKSNIA